MAGGSADNHVSDLQPNLGDPGKGPVSTASEFTPLISTEPLITETRVLNPAVDNPKTAQVTDVSEVSSVLSNSSDKDWLSHVGQLSLWSLPLLRICFMLFLVGVGLTVAQPSMEVIYYKLACQSLMQNDDAPPAQFRCDPVQSQLIVSTYLMWQNIVMSAVSLATCTKVSALSDIHGRKPFITAFVILTCASYYITYFFMLTSTGFPMWGLWMATAVGSLSGGTPAFMALFKAYITDITVALERVKGMSYCIVSFSAGQIGGPFLSSILLTHSRKKPMPKLPTILDPQIAAVFASPDTANLVPLAELIPLRACLFVFTVAVVFSFVFLLELRSHRSRMKSRSASVVLLQAPRPHLPTVWSKIWHGFTSFIEPLRLLTYPSELRNEENSHKFSRIRGCVFLLSLAELLFGIIILLAEIIEPQYTIYKYHWTSVKILNYAIARSCSVIFSLGVFLPLLYKLIFPRFSRLRPVANTLDAADSLVMACGLLLYSSAHIGKAFAPNGTIFVALTVLGSLASVVGPVAAAAPVKFYPSSKVGEFYGAIALAQGIINLFTPMVITKLYTFGVRHGFPGVSYCFTSATMLTCCGCVVTARMLVREKRSATAV